MDTITKSSAIYQKNYENHHQRILESAEKLFIRDGVERVSMNAIADEARIARKTLYKYFPNKQEIAFAIFERFIEQSILDFEPEHLPQGNGFQQLEFYLLDLSNMLERHPVFFRFLVEFNVLYAREGSPERVRQMYAAGNDFMQAIIHQGIEDNSIRSDLDADFLLAAIFNLISAMNARFALVGNQIGEEYQQPVKELYQGILRIFLQGIKGC